MSQQIILNGRQSNIAPNEPLRINRMARFVPPNINGLMQTDVAINGLTRRPTLAGCVLDLPLYLTTKQASPFKSVDNNAHSCTVTGATWTPQGRTFDGNDKIVTAASASLAVNTGSFELWFKGSEAGQTGARIADIWTSGSHNIEILVYPANTLSFAVRKNYTAIVDLQEAITITRWHHVVGTWNVSGAYLHVDGVEEGSVVGDKRATLTTPIVSIGVRGDESEVWFKGTVGDVLVYNRALASSEIQHNYLATKWRYSG